MVVISDCRPSAEFVVEDQSVQETQAFLAEEMQALAEGNVAAKPAGHCRT